MMRKTIIAALAALTITLSAFAQKDEFAGFYKGTVEAKKCYPSTTCPDVYAEVYRGPNQKYRLRLLPVIMNRCDVFYDLDNLEAKDGKIEFKGASKYYDLKGEITPKEIVAEGFVQGKNPAKLKLERMEIVPPTLGQKAPEGAVVLFDGKNFDAWRHGDANIPVNWTLKDGVMTVRPAIKEGKKRIGGSIFTKEKFGPFKLHLEFMMPCYYDKLGQARANSGVIVGDYEVQLLDSFGTEGLWNECASVYRQVAPLVNASTEPGTWQTYDIIFKPAVIENGKLVKLPTFTVWHNGVLVQKDTEIAYRTSLFPDKGAEYQHSGEPVSIQLQDHGDLLSFRNIWLQKL